MNNLNNPPQWNIRPNGDDGERNKWNYALLVPMLGLAAFRWIWTKESEKEIQKAKSVYLEKVTIAEKDLETKYRDIILENKRAVAHLEIELEKEQNRTLSYRNALISQSKKLVEDKKQMELERDQLKQELKETQKSSKAQALFANELVSQSKKLVEDKKQMELERDQLKQELKETQKSSKAQALFANELVSQSKKLVEDRKQMELERDQLKQELKETQKSSKAQALFARHLEKEEEWQTKAKSLLKEFENALAERQNIFCSLITPKKTRLEIEKKMLIKAASNPIAAEMGMTDGLLDIFKHDNHCAVVTNTNTRENGRLMWVYLKYWELTVDLKKFKRWEEAMIGK